MMYFCGPSMPWPRTVIASPEANWVTMKRTTRTAATAPSGGSIRLGMNRNPSGGEFWTSIWKLSPLSM